MSRHDLSIKKAITESMREFGKKTKSEAQARSAKKERVVVRYQRIETIEVVFDASPMQVRVLETRGPNWLSISERGTETMKNTNYQLTRLTRISEVERLRKLIGDKE